MAKIKNTCIVLAVTLRRKLVLGSNSVSFHPSGRERHLRSSRPFHLLFLDVGILNCNPTVPKAKYQLSNLTWLFALSHVIYDSIIQWSFAPVLVVLLILWYIDYILNIYTGYKLIWHAMINWALAFISTLSTSSILKVTHHDCWLLLLLFCPRISFGVRIQVPRF